MDKQQLKDLVQAALVTNTNWQPSELLDFLISKKNALELTKDDQSRLWDLTNDLRISLMILSEDQKPFEIQKRLCWLFSAIRTWEATNDKNFAQIALVFGVYYSLENNLHGFPDLFSFISPDALENANLRQMLIGLIKGIKMDVGVAPSAPIYEQEMLKYSQEANQNDDWIFIVRHWQCFNPVLGMSFPFPAALPNLHALDRSALVNLLDQQRDWLALREYFYSLDADMCLGIAEKAKSDRLKYCAFQSYLDLTPKNVKETKAQKDLILSILMERAQDLKKWRYWLICFNQYPIRSPQIQEALGECLSKVSESHWDIYLSSMKLHATQQNVQYRAFRNPTSKCLEAFRITAPLDKRKAFWKMVFGFWKEWEFGVSEEESSYLFDIHETPLDYAIIGYYYENMTQDERIAEDNKLYHHYKNLDREWYKNSMERTTAKNLILSKLQPVCQALRVAEEGTPWLNPEKILTYNFERTSRYEEIRNRI